MFKPAAGGTWEGGFHAGDEKADALLILPGGGRLSITCVHRRNVALAQMKAWTF